MFNITINEQEGRLVAAFSGDLDNVASSQAERDLAPVFERTDCDVAILRGLEAEVKEVFELSGFLQLFRIEN